MQNFNDEIMIKSDDNIIEYRNNLKNYFLQFTPETNIDELSELVNQFTIEKFSKNEFLIKAGEKSDTFYFLIKGLVRIYYYTEEKEITNMFAPENNIVIGAYSIITGEKNYSNYEAYENTISLKINYDVLESFYKKYHSLERLGRILIEKYYTAFMYKTYSVLFLSAEERYQILLKENPDLFNRVSLKHIASYLGIQQETLSRLRAKY